MKKHFYLIFSLTLSLLLSTQTTKCWFGGGSSQPTTPTKIDLEAERATVEQTLSEIHSSNLRELASIFEIASECQKQDDSQAALDKCEQQRVARVIKLITRIKKQDRSISSAKDTHNKEIDDDVAELKS